MNAELTAMIEAGRKLIEGNAKLQAAEAAEEEARALRLKNAHLTKLPPWMHEYVTCPRWENEVRFYLNLPGCAPIYANSRAWLEHFEYFGVVEPLSILFDDDEGWYVGTTLTIGQEIETAVALAAEHGESYWAMRAEADRRNAEGLRPEPTPAPEPTIEQIVTTMQLTPTERIAISLERIAGSLEDLTALAESTIVEATERGSDEAGNPTLALRIIALR